MSLEIYERCVLSSSDRMYRYALSIVKEKETARDIVQDCLASIWKLKHDLYRIEKLQAWIFRIVRNRCLEIIRKNKYTMLAIENVDHQYSNETEIQVISKDFIAFIHKLISSFPMKQREVFHLREIEDMSYADIAKTCDITEADVKINIHRVRKKIKEFLVKNNYV